MINFLRIIFALTISLVLASCSTIRPISEQGKELIKPEQFVIDRMAGIDRSVSLGPKVAVNSQRGKAIKRNERRQVNKTERINYLSLGDSKADVFPITVNFQNIGVQDMAIMFSEITGKNILVGDEVDGKVSAKIVDVNWDKALDAILKTKKLAKTVDHKANIIRIHTQDVLVAQEEFDRKRIEDMQKVIEAQRSIEPIYTEIFKLYYTDSKAIKAEIEAVLGSGGGEEDGNSSNKFKITIDERLNSLIVQATKTELDLVARLIKEVDIRTKQVLIEAFIVEADDTYSMKLGNKFGVVSANNLGNLDGNHYNVTGTGSGGSLVADAAGSAQFLLSTSSSVLKIELSADEQNGVTKIISNPKVFTLDNQEAIIKQVVQIPYKVVQEGEVTYEFKEAGLILTVTPSIVGDGNIILSVKVEKSSPRDIAGTDSKSIDTSEIVTKLLVQDNTVVVIGGVYTQDLKDTSSGVPLLGDIPIVGGLFKTDSSSDSRKELLIFLAPRVI
jgi:type IV pilus assembly protein PilQ